ncbi:MAG: hypothetical protein IKC13_06720 [Elusimicrobiaceae bacterium]|nr:hypothetical protein [Elusimicrobiaceae bacterium]
MRQTLTLIKKSLHNNRAQILLPAVMLAPIFILVVYLLFETAKLSMVKVENQFALDNGAYTQMSATSGYLNGMAQVNAVLPYRVMKTMSTELVAKSSYANKGEKVTVFDVFYTAGAFPAMGPNHEMGPNGAVANPPPAAESTDWNFQYYKGMRADWNKEDPKLTADKDGKVIITSEHIADNYFFGFNAIGQAALREWATIYIRTQSIYLSQDYVYKDMIEKSKVFRESYYLNTKGSCKKRECGRQAAETLERFELETEPFEIDDIIMNITNDFGSSNSHAGYYELPIKLSEVIKTKLFQFAYLTPQSRTRLRRLQRGVSLKQKFQVPSNRFNINITQRYKPYVTNSVTISCPRSSNNCVWPNPLPKYSVKVGL